MKIFKAIIIFALPLILFINIYRFIVAGDDSTYGFQAFVEYFSTFNGLDSTLGTIRNMTKYIGEYVSAYQNENILDFLKSFFQMVGAVFYIPIAVLQDIVRLLMWLIRFITGMD